MLTDFTNITFPGLGLDINPSPTIDLGFTTIRWYGVLIALGLILAVVYGLRRAKKFGLKEDDILDGVLWVVPFAIVCARLYYCVLSWDSYKDDPISILYIWKGGLAIPGGILGAVAGVIVYTRVKKISTFAVFDLVALGFLIGQCIGRWGNFFNREAFGETVSENYFLAMGLFNTETQQMEYYHPTFFYESLWNAIGFAILHFTSKKRLYDGQMALGYVAWYGFGRTFTEALRASTDALKAGDNVPFTLILSAACCAVALGILLIQWFRPQDRSRLYVNRAAAEPEMPEAPEQEEAERSESQEPEVAEASQPEEPKAEE